MRDKAPSRTGGGGCAGKLSPRRRLRGRTASSSSTKFDNGDRALSLLARKIAPEAVFCRAAYLSSLRQSFDGSRIVRILPLSAISVLPFFAASTVMYCTSLTRMPVEQMVSIRSARPRSPAAPPPQRPTSRIPLALTPVCYRGTGGAEFLRTVLGSLSSRRSGRIRSARPDKC